MTRKVPSILGSLVLFSLIVLPGCRPKDQVAKDHTRIGDNGVNPATPATPTPPGATVLDEARAVNRSVASFPAAGEDYFHDMDGGVALSPDADQRPQHLDRLDGRERSLLGRHLGQRSFGTLDFLKTLSSHPTLKFSRDNRWHYLGLVNEPCFEKATGPDPNRFGLWLDKRRPDCPPDPFENEKNYPGRRDRRARQEPAGRLLLRLRHRHRRPAALSQSRVR